MKPDTARRLFPLFHWIATLVLGPLIDGLIRADAIIVKTPDIFLTVLIASVIHGFPALIIYLLIYRATARLFKTNWELRVFLVVIAGALMLATLTFYDPGLQQDLSLPYAIAIVVSSLFLPVGKSPAERKKSSQTEQR
jgi:hypothetical protein